MPELVVTGELVEGEDWNKMQLAAGYGWQCCVTVLSFSKTCYD
jgi:hypothetical protein